MKTIVCYGDSNTWGYNPATANRFSITERWTGVLAQELGADYHVIEEGLNGRTTIWDDPFEEGRNGKTYFLPCLWSHQPIDLVTIMLGTNDLKQYFLLSAYDIAVGAGTLVDLALRSGAGPGGCPPQVLLLSPPVVGLLTNYAEVLEGAEIKSARFDAYYQRMAERYRCHFMDTAPIVTSSPLDGIHFEADQHQRLGVAVAARVREVLC
jgi:lysophospholipase L1-like esterase